MVYTPNEIAVIQKRTLRVLVLSQMTGSAALAAAVTVGAFVIQDILGQATAWGGIASATVTMGTAFMSQILARLMNIRGRRNGLQTGYLLAILGGFVAGYGAETKTLWIFMIGLFIFGNGQASNLLSRYAATDLATIDERGRAMSRILFASTFGAVFGPLLIKPAEQAGMDWFGWGQYTGPWVFSGVFFLTSLINTTLRLKPDPLEVAGRLNRQSEVGAPSRLFSDAIRAIRGSSNAKIAVLSMVISQMAMVAVMTMTPVHLKLHGHETVSAYIISLHVAGMYAFSPLVGRFADRRGRLSTIQFGAVVLMCATLLSSLAGGSPLLLYPALWMLGVGWSFGLIGGSSLLVDSIDQQIRVRVQGAADLTMSFCGGLAGFSSGFIRKAVGYHVLSNFGMLLAGVLLVTVMLRKSVAERETVGVL
ncbi:MAG TPA: MFS transporter [Acidimicrobium sp.]|jgi:MFS family permease|nr:MFS transporter [Acidimicrobium sp.]